MKIARLAIAAALFLGGCTHPSASERRSARIATIVDPIVEADLAESGIPGAAYVFVRNGRIVHLRGYGMSDLEAAIPAGPRTVWPIASITKVFTALAALQLVNQGRLGLDRDVNLSLRRLQVPSQGYSALTLRHLLSHTGGLDELPGRRFDGQAPPDLAGFLRSRLIRYREPGRRTAYSSYGIALAGILVEDASGEPYAEYLRHRIFAPAGMASARVMAVRGDERGVAMPYAIEDGRAERIGHEYYVSTPASSIVASAEDMGRFMIALLAAQRGRHDLLPGPMLREMLRQQSTVHPALPGWGLGLQLDRVNGVRIAEHGGDIGGFSALMVLMPDFDEGFFIVHHGEGGDLRFRVKDALLDSLHPSLPMAVPAPDPSAVPRLAEYAGRYASSMSCRTCADAPDTVFEVAANADGSLQLWGQKWIPFGRDLFVKADGRRLLGFSRDPDGRIDAVTGGSWRVADRLP